MLLRFLRASLLFPVTIPTVSQSFNFPQLPQVSKPFFMAHCLMGQSDRQYGGFTPSTRHPAQFIISGVIFTPLSSDQYSAVLRLSSSSLFIAARRASHASQLSPQTAINLFTVSHLNYYSLEKSSAPFVFR